MLLSLVIENHLAELERLHGADLLPSHRQALRAMARCRRQGSDLMVLECPDCKETVKIPILVGIAAVRIASTMKASNGWRNNKPNYYPLSISWSPSQCPLR